MAATDYTSKTAMITFVSSRVVGADAAEIEALLVASAADNCAEPAVTTYRPYWVIAALLDAYPPSDGLYKSVRSASGAAVEYRDVAGLRRGLKRLQRAQDASLCNIPEGYGSSGNVAEVVF